MEREKIDPCFRLPHRIKLGAEKKKNKQVKLTTEMIENQTIDFLKSGGVIDLVETGHTGVDYAKPPKKSMKNIKLM